MKLSVFKSKVGKLVRPNFFRAQLFLNGGDLSAAIGSITDTFEFRCEKAELPGRTLATTDDLVGGGPGMKLPYDITYNDTLLSIICSSDMKERIFFEKWMDFIVTPGGKQKAGLVNYYSKYALGTKLQVDQLDEAGEVLFTYNLHDVYPIAITPMNATWEETNTYQRFGVTLAYRYHTYE